jgi:sarcosine oxidase, subunit gamma
VTVTERSSIEAIREQLAAFAKATGGALALRLWAPHTQLHLHLGPVAPARLGERLGAAVPVAANTWAGSDPVLVWTAPGEYLLLSQRPVEELLSRPAEPGMTVVDVSSARMAFDLSGSGARELLASGCSIDLHPAAFGPGSSALTLFAGVGIVLMQLDEEPRFRLLARRSFCVHLAGLLLDGATEMEV